MLKKYDFARDKQWAPMQFNQKMIIGALYHRWAPVHIHQQWEPMCLHQKRSTDISLPKKH